MGYLIVGFILAFSLLFAAYAYRIAFFSSKKRRGATPHTDFSFYGRYRPTIVQLYQDLLNVPCEFVTIRSRDGLILSGRCYMSNPGAPVDICFHGYRSHPLSDFCGGSRLSFEMGHNVLLVDQRAHGLSQGRSITFGIREREDALEWIKFALEKFGSDCKITLFGVSMGAATVLMASGLKLPHNVRGIVADCPYDAPEEIILTEGKKMHYPPALIRPFLHLGAFLYGGFRLSSMDCSRAVRDATVPIMIIHGLSDTLVPPEQSEKIARVNPALVRRYTFPNAEHAVSYLVDTDRYETLVRDFTGEILK